LERFVLWAIKINTKWSIEILGGGVDSIVGYSFIYPNKMHYSLFFFEASFYIVMFSKNFQDHINYFMPFIITTHNPYSKWLLGCFSFFVAVNVKSIYSLLFDPCISSWLQSKLESNQLHNGNILGIQKD